MKYGEIWVRNCPARIGPKKAPREEEIANKEKTLPYFPESVIVASKVDIAGNTTPLAIPIRNSEK